MYFYSQSVDWENRNMTFYHSNQMSLALSSLTQTWMNVPQEHPHVRRCVQTLLDPSPAAAEKVTNWILISSPVQVRKSLELKTEFSMVTRFPDSDTDSEFHSDCKLNDHIVLCRPFHTAWSQIQISIITANYRNGGGIWISIRIWICECNWAIKQSCRLALGIVLKAVASFSLTLSLSVFMPAVF